MPTDPTRQAAQEFLAEKRTQDFEAQEARLNHEAAVRLCRVVWKRFSDTVLAKAKSGTKSQAKRL